MAKKTAPKRKIAAAKTSCSATPKTSGKPAAATAVPRAYVMLEPQKKTARGAPANVAAGRELFIASAARPTAIDQARQALEEYGFRIVQAEPHTITIEAPKELFREVFHAPVAKSTVPKGSGRETSWPRTTWKWSKPPQIPEGLQALISSVVFPRTAALHTG